MGLTLSAIVSLAKLALVILQALGWANNLAERRAGRAESQQEANNAETNRINRAAAAGTAVTGLRDNAPDPYDDAGT